MPAPRVALLVTCVVDVLAPGAGIAAVRLLRAAGAEVDVPEGQTCCGQPAWNAGFADEAARVAAATLDALEGAEAVVVPSGSCTAMVRRFWPELFEAVGDAERAARARQVAARTHELTEWLADAELPPLRSEAGEVAQHHGCHLLRELGVRSSLLERVEGVEVAPWPDAERCCGFGGAFSVKLPEVAEAMADEKLRTLPRPAGGGPTTIVSTDVSCLVHLAARAEATGDPVEVRHVAEVLAAALPPDEASP
jgi:L-lactate dehydrogenase complex protein LldE